MNKVILLGRLGKDPESRDTKSGGPMCSFTIATSKKIKGEEQTCWHNISSFGKTAELCVQYLAKGKQALIEGEISNRSYDDKDGNKKYFSEVIAQKVVFIGSKGEGEVKPKISQEFTTDDIPF